MDHCLQPDAMDSACKCCQRRFHRAAQIDALTEQKPSETTHELKCWPEFFKHIASGEKTFEARKDDRGYKAGDILHLREWTKAGGYTGRQALLKVTYLLAGLPWLQKDYVVMGFPPVGFKPIDACEVERQADAEKQSNECPACGSKDTEHGFDGKIVFLHCAACGSDTAGCVMMDINSAIAKGRRVTSTERHDD
jgi:hypothetical protein